MLLKLKLKITKLFITVKFAIRTLFSETGVRAEFHSSIAFMFLFYWLNFVPRVEPATFVNSIDKFMSHNFLGYIFLLIALFQTYANIGHRPKERLIAAMIACLAWSAVVFIGILTSFNYLIVPIALSFAIVQALVFIHLENIEV